MFATTACALLTVSICLFFHIREGPFLTVLQRVTVVAANTGATFSLPK